MNVVHHPRYLVYFEVARTRWLRDLGLLDMLHPEELNVSALTEWMARELEPVQVHGRINFSGLDRLPGLVEDLRNPSRQAATAV